MAEKAMTEAEAYESEGQLYSDYELGAQYIWKDGKWSFI